MKRTVSGLEKFLKKDGAPYRKARLGLLANQASVGPEYTHGLELLDEAMPGAVTALFGPQHGWAGEKQDNMVESNHGLDRRGRPIFSLYGETRRPDRAMLAQIDVLLIDLADVGARVYTFAQTMSYCLEEAAGSGVEVVILDRPNPIGGAEVEGNILAADCRSFVGLHPVPMRHGLTMAEMALYVNKRLKRPAALNCITCDNWRRGRYFPQTGLPWVLPSPNMPTCDCAWVYPGQVLWEATNVSEGRGTTRPFNLVGAPFIDAEALLRGLKKIDLPGVRFRKAHFQPTFHKWVGAVCRGLELFPLDSSFKPYLTSLAILGEIVRLWPDQFQLKAPPYEYEFERRPIDLILGERTLFDRLAGGEDVAALEESWQPGLRDFLDQRAECLLYE
ncbi:MAG: DUF1343 domain-containing protein [Candidatus Adiutrix sp.]|jgi:uncharacterized protein YbbC (DUF1343 family)|nr:DUF1343 domain-containing protein [Candidatus Adiutrix sp.]